jgi:putative holliday junction resolvase
MGRILAMDYGMKRTGLAVTDPLKIIATGLTTVDTPQLFNFLKDYIKKEVVDLFLIGEPKNLDDSDTHITQQVAAVILRLKKEFPQIPVQGVDERYTSKMASRAMVEMGMKKKQRRDKKIIDEIAATIMLQEYLQQGTF